MILETETKITKIDGIEEAHTMFRWSNSREFQFSNEINSIVTDEIIQKKRKNQTDNLKNWNLIWKNVLAFINCLNFANLPIQWFIDCLIDATSDIAELNQR